MKSVILSLGSNIGDRKKYLKQAVESLISSNKLTNIKLSSIYETDPVDFINQPKFLNLCILAKTELKANDLMQLCKAIEIDLGRKKRAKWHEREIDIDIIFYNNEIIDETDLVIPHPRMHLRKFVLEPIFELTPEFVHPVYNLNIEQLLKKCPDESQVLIFDKLEL
ncbi:MAG: 2-amino-4-hydroxy-6-hydroxymethyldihydropteridine diphosphokinase [Candidatus Kapabacteria bacterium]|nr:2-amino-4-hydroxy-6-hydroxymethyldihydropteridine diphosphokinase [Candidatus Kapabacteria bacterium]